MKTSHASSSASGIGAIAAVTLIWAFSFGLIGKALAGVDPFLIGSARLVVAGLCFLPLLRLKGLPFRTRCELSAIGVLQFGVMYVSYLAAFRFLEAWQVALFSVLTPLWIAGINSAIHRRLEKPLFLAAVLSVVGAAIIKGDEMPRSDFLTGFLLMQIANIAFGGGQIWFREWKFRHPSVTEKEVFGLLFAGALTFTIVAGLLMGSFRSPPHLSPSQWMIIIYLGIAASGAGFYLWNFGASRVSTGFLAASNNLVVPLGVFIAILLNRSQPDWLSLVIGSLLIGAGLVVGRRSAVR
ncbi:MAG: EamA family transporter [Verrucomicrobiota bacterium]